MSLFQETLVVSPFQSNCYVLACDESRDAVVIDPGDEAERILDVIHREALRVTHILHTHAHLDHMMGTRTIHEETGAPIYLHEADRWLYENLALQNEPFQLPIAEPCPLTQTFQDGAVFAFGPFTVTVIHTPGHSPGGCCFQLNDPEQRLFSGDALFRGSIGRTDLWEGSSEVLLQSIRERLLGLPDNIPVYPGHGDPTTIGEERQHNPFLQDFS